jgi:hypothetical protein
MREKLRYIGRKDAKFLPAKHYAASLCLCVFAFMSEAQTIIRDLETDKRGEGKIRIEFSPENIASMLGTPTAIPAPEIRDEPQKVTAYRIQVYMGNSREAKSEAERIVRLLGETFPETAVHLKYDAPNWRVLAGNFQTMEEADFFKQTLQTTLPELKREMYIVSGKISSTIFQK